MAQQSDTAVLIVGAGPTGLALACDLARRGVPLRIIDRAPDYASGSRGKGIQPRSLEVLDDLGVLAAVVDAGAPYPPIRSYNGATVVWEGHMHEQRAPTPDVPYPNLVLIPQWRTEAILRERLAGYGVQVGRATELTSFDQDRDGVTALLACGDATERVRAAYLVGADGGHSAVRHALGVGFVGETFATDRMLVGDVCVDGLDRAYWHTWMNPDTRTLRLGLCPLSGTRAFQVVAPLPADAEPALSLAALQAIVDHASGHAGLRLRDLSWLSLYRANIRMAQRYRVGRVFLAGDAAHVHSPAGGQGLNTGIQDAYNLGWKLGQALAGAPDALLDTYEAERLPVAADMLGLSTRLHQRAKQGAADALRRGAETQQLGINYRESALVARERASPTRVRAGDRAPDAPCHTADGSTVRLFDVFRGPHTTLLAFGSGHAATVAALSEQYGGAVCAHTILRPGERASGDSLVDTHGHAHRAYDIDADTLVLVRPDGYLGLVSQSQSPQAIEDFFHKVGIHPTAKRGTLERAARSGTAF